MFQLSLDLHYTEDEIYELSLAREPRTSLSAVRIDTALFNDETRLRTREIMHCITRAQFSTIRFGIVHGSKLLMLLLQPSTPTKPVQFSDWVSGVSPPDPDTINKHVHDMVEVSYM